MAMLAVDKGLQKKKLDARLILSVHDELLLEVRTSDVETGKQTGKVMAAARLLLEEAMKAAAAGKMPDVNLIVVMFEGKDWKEISVQKEKV